MVQVPQCQLLVMQRHAKQTESKRTEVKEKSKKERCNLRKSGEIEVGVGVVGWSRQGKGS